MPQPVTARESRAIVAFGENGGFFSCRPDGENTFYTLGSLPKGFTDVLVGAEGHTYFWASVGPAGQYYISWKRRDGQHFWKMGRKEAGLSEHLHALHGGDISKVKVIFGPEKGTWVMISGKGAWRAQNMSKAPGLQHDIDRSTKGVRHVALGHGGAWVVAYRDGTVHSDLKGQYGTLQRVLDDMSTGDLRGVFLDPFNSSNYVVGYKNESRKSNLPNNYQVYVSF